MYTNYTPHVLNIRLEDGSWVKIPPVGGLIPRVEYPEESSFNAGGVIIHKYKAIGEVVNHSSMMSQAWGGERAFLSSDGGVAITSMAVAQALCHPSVLSPGELIRDKDGNAWGADGFKQWSK